MAPRKRKPVKQEEESQEEEEAVIDAADDDDDDDFDGEDEEEEEEKPKKGRKKAAAKKPPAKPAAPKKKGKKKNDDDEEDDEDEDDSEDEKPKKKSAKVKKEPAAKKEPATKKAPSRKKKSKDDDDVVVKDEDEAPKAKKPKIEKITEPTTLEDGFTAHPPSLLFKQFSTAVSSKKVAAFDLDGTLILSKSDAKFTTNSDDWYTYNDSVVDKLKQYHEDGYKIVVFSNQGSIQSMLAGAASAKVRGKVSNFIKTVPVPVLVLMATNRADEYRKPEIGMWTFMCENLNGGEVPDLSDCFFVGDDIDGGDQGFADNVGITFRSTKAEFGDPAPPPSVADVADGPNAELIGVFGQLIMQAKEAAKEGDGKAVFKARAFEKVVEQIKNFPKKITDDSKVLKEVSSLPGVGKGSLQVIKDFLRDGTVQALNPVPANRIGQAVGSSKDREEAMQFM